VLAGCHKSHPAAGCRLTSSAIRDHAKCSLVGTKSNFNRLRISIKDEMSLRAAAGCRYLMIYMPRSLESLTIFCNHNHVINHMILLLI
jgi:hypothetical protein